jgi:hypothetical protein
MQSAFFHCIQSNGARIPLVLHYLALCIEIQQHILPAIWSHYSRWQWRQMLMLLLQRMLMLLLLLAPPAAVDVPLGAMMAWLMWCSNG